MAFWLIKTEPALYSWEQLMKDRSTTWTGVRNFQARNNVRAMKPGDFVFIYHSGDERMVTGVAKVTSEPKADPSAVSGDWSSVDIEAVAPLARPVTLDEIKYTHILAVMPLITHTRLSVQPVTDAQAEMLLKIGKTTL
jgi:predicted RNA-binding protein with PUA-like domain